MFRLLKRQYNSQEFKERYWHYEWLKDGFIDLLYSLDIFFIMIIMWPSIDSAKFQFNAIIEFECYEQERDNEMY